MSSTAVAGDFAGSRNRFVRLESPIRVRPRPSAAMATQDDSYVSSEFLQTTLTVQGERGETLERDPSSS
jgi:hypothetical protein